MVIILLGGVSVSQLSDEQIELIKSVYKKNKSIIKTAKITKFSNVTINKYVKYISCKDTRSRYCINKINQIDLTNNCIIKTWDKPSLASKELEINLSEICRVAKGELKQAGGFGWKYTAVKI